MATFSFEKNQIHFESNGEGDAIIFLHGFLEDLRMWNDIVPHFKGFRIIQIDLPCHGESKFDGDKCSMKKMAEIIAAFLKDQKIQDPFVVGHSMGGYVGLELLKIQKIKLTLLHSNFWADSKEKKQDRDRVIQVVQKNHKLFVQEAIPNLFDPLNTDKCKSTIQELVSSAKKMTPQGIIAATSGMRDRVDNRELLIEHEVHIIQGQNDPIIPTKKLNSELDEIAGLAKLLNIEKVGHMSIWEDQKSLISCLKKIIN